MAHGIVVGWLAACSVVELAGLMVISSSFVPWY